MTGPRGAVGLREAHILKDSAHQGHIECCSAERKADCVTLREPRQATTRRGLAPGRSGDVAPAAVYPNRRCRPVGQYPGYAASCASHVEHGPGSEVTDDPVDERCNVLTTLTPLRPQVLRKGQVA